MPVMDYSKIVKSLPPQGYAHMTGMQRFDHKVRCAIIELLDEQSVGSDNIIIALQMIVGDLKKA